MSAEEKQTLSGQTNSWFKKDIFKKGAVQASYNIHNRTSQLCSTLLTWNSNREQYLEVQTSNSAILGKQKEYNQILIWLKKTDKSKDLQC